MTALEKIQGAIPEGVDAILLTDEVTQSYASGFNFTDGYVLIGKSFAYLITDGRYIEAAKAAVSDDIIPVLGVGDLGKYLDSEKVKTLGFEDRRLSVADFGRMKDRFKNIEFVPVSAALDALRETKEEYEIQNIISAQRIAEEALSHMLEKVNKNMTEREFALLLDFEMSRLGAEGPAFETIAVSGSASSLPHGVPRDKKLENGFFTVDFGATFRGYRSDMTRTFVIGHADEEMRRMYETVLAAQEAGQRAAAPGVKCSDIDKAARAVIEAAGYGEYFTHSLGHGVGRYIHEAPNLSPRSPETMILKKGNVVTDEPGIYIEGKQGLRIEDMLVVREDKVENITLFPKKLTEIC